MQKIVRFTFFFTLFFLTSCGVTPMLNLPAGKQNAVTAEPNPGLVFTGTWFDPKDSRTVTITPRADKEKVLFGISLLDKPNEKKDNLNPLPFIGIPVKYAQDGELFFILATDMEKVRSMAKTSEFLGFVTRPYFYLVRPVIRQDGKLEVSFIHWLKKENGKEVVTDPGVRMQNGLVTNSSEELVRLIESKKYVLTNVMLFERKKPDGH